MQPQLRRDFRATLFRLVVWTSIALHGGLLLLESEAIAPAWLGELVRFVPFYWVLIPLCLALLASLFTRPIWIGAAISNLALFVIHTMDFHWNPIVESSVVGTHVRVVSYNIKALFARQKESGFAAIEQEIQKYAPDIVALQDAQKWLTDSSSAVPTNVPPAFGLPYVVAFDQYVLASRYPLQSCKTGKLDARAKPAPYLQCRALIAGKSVELVTVHFVSPRTALLATKTLPQSGVHDWQKNYAARLAQSQALLVDLSHITTPMIVMGDFNAAEHSSVIANLKLAGLQNTFSRSGTGWGYTHGHSLNKKIDLYRIDHILVSQSITPTKSEVGMSDASQHNPVIADLVIHP